jgi:prepilin-type N-terminal cleavage/methylation domain-containing protein
MQKIQLGLLKQFSGQDQGFSLVEVLIAILIASIFLLGALQALALQAVIKVRAERKAQATFWIQKDIESIKAAASDVVDDTTSSRCRATTYNNGFAYKLRDNLFNNKDGTGTAFDTSKVPRFTLDSAVTGVTNPNIQVADRRALVGNKIFYRLVRVINPDANNANILKITYRVGLEKTDTKDITEQTAANAYDVTKDPSSDINKYDQLQDDGSSNPSPLGKTSIIAEQYVEVIPNVALTC